MIKRKKNERKVVGMKRKTLKFVEEDYSKNLFFMKKEVIEEW